MKFLVATTKALVLVDNKKTSIVHKGIGTYSGVTWNKDKVFVSFRNEDGVCKHSGQEGILTLDKNFKELDRTVFSFFDDLHQIYYCNGELLVANTAKERMDILEDGMLSATKYFSVETDTNHFNSIFYDGESYWVVHHRRGPSKILRLNSDFEIVETISLGNQVHNVYVDEKQLIVLSSGTNSLMIQEWDQKFPKTHRFSEWLRGLVVTDDRYFIGQSSMHAERSKRIGLPSYILEASADKKEIIDTIEMTDFGLIYDLRALEGDKAHNGIEF